MKTLRNLAFALGLAAVAALALNAPRVNAAATTQTTHAYMCAPDPGFGGANRRIVVPTTNGGTYNLNGQGCALIVGADIGYFVSQGFSQGQNLFTLQQTGITSSTTASTSTITLPAYAVIQNIILSETSGQAVTGGVNVGDSGSATRFASAVALTSNNTVVIADSALTRVFANSGVPAADQILVACQTSCNSSSINITILYSFW